jgi:hypothetical protein
LVPLVSVRYSLLPLVFLLTQFYPTLVPFAQKSVWSPSPSILTDIQGGPTTHFHSYLRHATLRSRLSSSSQCSTGSLLLGSSDAARRLVDGTAARQESSSPARRPASSTAWQQPRWEELQVFFTDAGRRTGEEDSCRAAVPSARRRAASEDPRSRLPGEGERESWSREKQAASRALGGRGESATQSSVRR